MLQTSGFDVATIFQTAATMCRAKKGPFATAMKVEVEESEEGFNSLGDTTLEAARHGSTFYLEGPPLNGLLLFRE